VSVDVFLFPHQDDEIGVFHVIDECVKSKWRLMVVYVTDGAWQHTTAAVRNAESSAVLKRLGVSQDSIWFLGQERNVADRGLTSRLEEVFSALQARLSSGPEVTAIYTPAWEGGHPDHDATALLATALGRSLGAEGRVRQFPMYSAYRADWLPFRVFAPIREAASVVSNRIPLRRRIEHLALCRLYRSQMKTFLGLFPFLLAHYTLNGVQQYQSLDAAVIGSRPHAGKLLYERRRWLSWEQFEHDVCAFKSRHFA
jgi:LmbE family N-acetylglucosaminyl deacetylase